MTQQRTKPPSKSKQTKIPDRKVFADELAVEVEGETYYPHAGEYVIFRGSGQSVAAFLDAIDLQTADIRTVKAEDVGDDLNDSQIAATKSAGDLFKRTIYGAVNQIVEWNWTNNAGQPYASPPAYEDLISLGFEELNWLLSGGRKKETPLADESPSTSP